MDPAVEALREQIDRGFEDVHRRLDDNRDLQTERHNTNLAKLTTLDADQRRVEAKVDTINGTVIRHTSELQNISLLGKPATIADLRLYLGIAAGSVVGLVWLLHVVGTIK